MTVEQLINTTICDIATKTVGTQWFTRSQEILDKIYIELQPDIPTDGSTGYIAFNVPGKDRMKLRTARFLTRKLNLNHDFLNDQAIQAIAEKINAVLFGAADSIELVSGEKITQAYKDKIGNNSCMAGSNADCTLLYEMNPDRFQMLIMQHLNNSARAIVHKLDNGAFYLDRVYSDSEELEKKMYNYADQQNWFSYCQRPNSSILRVSNLVYEDGHVPYMDTMIEGTITSKNRLNISACDGELDLTSTDGCINNSRCEGCGDIISENDRYIAGDDVYCQSCFDEHFFYCEYCSEATDIDDIVYIEDVGENLCPSCAENRASRCDGCNKWHSHKVSLTETSDNKCLCEDCIEDYICCDDCGEYFPSDDVTRTDDDQYVCKDCAEDYSVCENCEQLFNYELVNNKCESCNNVPGQLSLGTNQNG